MIIYPKQGRLDMANPTNHGAAAQRFIELGVLLFLLGLVTGFAIPFMSSLRMGLSSHLEGVLNGIFLIALGLIWSRLALPGWAEKLAAVAMVGLCGLVLWGLRRARTGRATDQWLAASARG